MAVDPFMAGERLLAGGGSPVGPQTSPTGMIGQALASTPVGQAVSGMPTTSETGSGLFGPGARAVGAVASLGSTIGNMSPVGFGINAALGIGRVASTLSSMRDFGVEPTFGDIFGSFFGFDPMPAAREEARSSVIGSADPGVGGGFGPGGIGAGDPGGFGESTGGGLGPGGQAPSGASGAEGDPGEGGGADAGDGDGGDGDGLLHGGLVTKRHLKGKNPRGKDDGYVALDEGEYVISHDATKKYGPKLLTALNAKAFSRRDLAEALMRR